ncbi:phytoene desaturase family protein [Sediminitomix flava]|nr:phytoene desaturase family protein [Sediminitomix flava]
MRKVIVIGAGFSGLSSATTLAHAGYDVTVVEKHDQAGGRARFFENSGFKFDMGPSWYWMPEVFENYFNYFDRSVSDYYTLERLSPSYKVYWGNGEADEIPANLDELFKLFEKYEKGSSKKLQKFLADAKVKYEVGMNKFVQKPGLSIFEFTNLDVLVNAFKLDLVKSFYDYIRKYFSHPRLLQLIEFPILFLGATPKNTPALYSLMNYADIELGTWYPKGGMHKIVEGMHKLAEENGVKFLFESQVEKINVINGVAQGVSINGTFLEADYIVGSADYHHIDKFLLDEAYQNYSDKYWDKRLMAPSCLLYYLGVDKKLDGLLHHDLFFDAPFDLHAEEIYSDPQWPSNPLFYASVASKTDDTVAPEGCENLMLLVPIATGLEDTEEVKERYLNIILDRLEKHIGTSVKEHIVYKRAYASSDFSKDYFAFKGNAYGLANTLSQTAILKPSIKNKKVSNLFYTGQLTVPGPGVPPSIISGQVVAKQIMNEDESFKQTLETQTISN